MVGRQVRPGRGPIFFDLCCKCWVLLPCHGHAVLCAKHGKVNECMRFLLFSLFCNFAAPNLHRLNMLNSSSLTDCRTAQRDVITNKLVLGEDNAQGGEENKPIDDTQPPMPHRRISSGLFSEHSCSQRLLLLFLS
jgi:hypothetical protein